LLSDTSVAALLPGVDWAATPAGPPASWPASLQTALSICLDSRFPIVIFWGRELIQFYNDAYAAAILREKHPALGHRAQDCWADIWPWIKPLLDSVIDDGHATYSEDLYLPVVTDGVAQERYFTFSYSPIRTQSGIGGVFCAVTETTARILREREAQQRAEALAELDRAKTSFFSNVSHEFRTPLTLMLGPLEETLARARIAGDDRRQLTVAYRNCLRLLKLVNGLLDFTRAEAGRLEGLYEPTELALLTSDVASNFRSACEQAGISLVVDCRSLSRPVFVDPSMWETIVLNLISNAFKFTLHGAITIVMGEKKNEALLTVADTGTGISEKDLPHIFDRFYRSESAVGRTQEGSGIGLALVRGLIALHGGRIEVASTPGEGTTVTVRVPFGKRHLPSGRVRTVGQPAPSSPYKEAFVQEAMRWLPGSHEGTPNPSSTAETKKPRILLVDDNADMRDYIRHLLADMYPIDTASDGEAALESIERDPPALVLSDVMIPKLDGIELVKRLRQNPAYARLPVILISARAGEESRVEGLDAGADDYIVKPFRARDLVARVTATVQRELLRRREQSRSALDLPGPGLSARERAVLVRIAQGFTNKEIAGALGISTKTVETYKARFANKLDLHSRADIVRYAAGRDWNVT
jgi:signal transduction histidine kinase/DNA-binding NarL/FixJ family response regulator